MTTAITKTTWDGLMQTVAGFPEAERPGLIQGLRARFTIEADPAPAPESGGSRPTTRKETRGRDAAVTARVLDIRAGQPGISLKDAEAQARADVAYSRGEQAIEGLTAAELQEAIKAIPNDEAQEAMSRDWSSTGAATDITPEQAQAALDQQAARHRENRIQKLRAPFEDSYREDVQKYGKDSPMLVGNDVDARLHNVMTAQSSDADREPYREAIGYKPAKAASIFGDEGDDS